MQDIHHVLKFLCDISLFCYRSNFQIFRKKKWLFMQICICTSISFLLLALKTLAFIIKWVK